MSEDLLPELRHHEREYQSLVHGPLCGKAADEIDILRTRLHEAEKRTSEFFDEAAAQAGKAMRALAQLASARKALDLAEYVSRKDSLTEHERLSSVRTVVCAAISALTDDLRNQKTRCEECNLLQPCGDLECPNRVAVSSAYREESK